MIDDDMLAPFVGQNGRIVDALKWLDEQHASLNEDPDGYSNYRAVADEIRLLLRERASLRRVMVEFTTAVLIMDSDFSDAMKAAQKHWQMMIDINDKNNINRL